MEISINLQSTGHCFVLEVAEDETVMSLRGKIAGVVPAGVLETQYMLLQLDDSTYIPNDEYELLSSCCSLQDGSSLSVSESNERYIDAVSGHSSLNDCPPWTCNDPEVVQTAIRHCSSDYEHASPSLRNDEALLLYTLHHHKRGPFSFLRFMSDSLKDNDTVISAAVAKDGLCLDYASPRLKRCESMVMKAVQQNGSAIQYADESLKHDKSFIMRALHAAQDSKPSNVLGFCDARLRSDKEVVLLSVSKNPLSLQDASPHLQADHEIVIQAVRRDPYSLHFASPTLQANKTVVLQAVRRSSSAMQYASPTLANDVSFMQAAARLDGAIMKYSSSTVQNNKDVVLEAVKQTGYALEYASEGLQDDPEVVRAAVSGEGGGYCLCYASARCRAIKDIVLCAVRSDGFALHFADALLRSDPDVVVAAATENVYSLEYADDVLKGNPDFMLCLINKCGVRCADFISEEMKSFPLFQQYTEAAVVGA